MTTWSAVKSYRDSGLCVLPVNADRSKRPALSSWAEFQHRLPTEAELRNWFSGDCDGVGLVCGAISGGLEVIDFDTDALYEPWAARVEQESPGLLARLPQDITPRNGTHIYYRCSAISGNLKLARDTEGKALIETRGEGGFIVVPPTDGRYHPLGRPYRMIRGDLAQIPVITPEERATLLSVAMEFNRYRPVIIEAPKTSSAVAGDRPGDRWARNTTWAEILEPHGWKALRTRGEETFWQRPDKSGPGCSATTGYAGYDIFYVFSTNATPFDNDRGYTKFTAYTFLNHAGDFAAATRAVVVMGYGSEVKTSQLPPPESLNAVAETDEFHTLDRDHAFYGNVIWTWEPWIPTGHVTMICGDQGCGKSYFAARLLATLTGDIETWPDETAYNGPRGKVLLLETEQFRGPWAERLLGFGVDLAESVILPHADVTKIPDIIEDTQLCAYLVQRFECAGVIMDSLSGGHSYDENSAAMRDVLKKLSWLASACRVPVICVHHVRKKGQLESAKLTLDRVRGSTTISQFCRSIIGFSRVSDDITAPVRVEALKNNFAPPGEAFGMVVDGGGIAFGKAPEKAADRIVTKFETAVNLIKRELEKGPVMISDIHEKAARLAISQKTLYRAREYLRLVTADGAWVSIDGITRQESPFE